MIPRLIIGVVILFGVLLLMLPNTDEKSLTKIATSSMLMCTLDFRNAVAKQVENDEEISARFKNSCPSLIDTLTMGEEGGMVIKGKKYPVTMRLKPLVENGKVRWSCRGEPQEMISKLCKP